jgi:hypothetical protein
MKWKPELPLEKLELNYTVGNELMIGETLKEFVGTYYKKSGKFYTFIDQGKGPRDLLVKINKDKDFHFYNKVSKYPPLFDPILPTETGVSPEEKDYKKGYFDRIFSQKINVKDGVIKEITSDIVKAVNSKEQIKALYKIVKLRWKLTGPRFDVDMKKIYNPYSTEVTKDAFGQDDSGIVYGVEDTNRRTVKIKNKEMPGLDNKIINFVQFAQFTNVS